MLRSGRPFVKFILIVLILLVSGTWLPGARASTSPGAGTLLASADGGEVTFEVRVPWGEVSLEAVTADGGSYVRVSIPGWSFTSEAGAPEVPFLAEAIGAPFGVEVRVEVEPGPAHTIALPAPVLPAGTQRAEWGPPAADGVLSLPASSLVIEADPAAYSRQAAYPGALARVTGEGILRQQRVVGIAAYPVQYHPVRAELTVYESLTVSVTFEGAVPAPPEDLPAESPVYEEMLRQSLLNYEAARAWRSMQLPSPLGRGAGGEGIPWAPPDPGWRVKVREDGFYQLTYSELDAAGLPVNASLPTNTFQLFHLGSEVAIQVDDLDEDGVFDAEDSLVFYGQAVASKYTLDNVYWLTYGQGTGLRIGTRSAAPGEAATPANYPAQRHRETNVWYQPGAPGDGDLERWLWDYVYPPSRPSVSFTLPLAAPDTGQPATLTVVMLGGLSVQAINPDHHVLVKLNGTQVGEAWWDGVTWQTLEMPIAPGLLVAGSNTVQVVAPNDTGYGYDYFLVDWIELEYANTFLAEDDELAFGYEASGPWKFQVSGFSQDGVAVYDVTDPAAVVWLEGVDVNQVGQTYTAEFEEAVATPTDYRATTDTAYRTVQAIEADTPSDLGSTANGADHIVITHAAFAAQAQALRDHRASQELRAMVVDVQDIYDEFGHGLVGGAPIHDFLAYAYANWQSPAPSYVVLLGDGNYDPKNYAGTGPVSYVPPYLLPVDPWLGETAADNRYVTLVGEDTMPDMMLGRLAVNSDAEATAFVDKIIAYELTPEPGDWQTQVLAVADNADGGGQFHLLSDGVLGCCVPNSYEVAKVYYGVTHPTVDEARAAILAGINAGKLIVNYIGHAATQQWADEGLFKVTDVAGLTNGARLPVMLPMTCYDGYHINPTPKLGTDATGEVVTRADGKGAVASWSPTGLGVATGHDSLNRGFLEAVLVEGGKTVGEGTMAGKLRLWATGSNLDLLDTYLLFGDAALYVRAEVAPTQVTITGPTEGLAQTAIPFTAAVEPGGASLPITYVWSATEQEPITHTAGISDTIEFSWTEPGTKTIGVTADNGVGSVSGEHQIHLAAGEAHVAAILTAARPVGASYRLLLALTGIRDQNNQPVPGATVKAQWTLPNGYALPVKQSTTTAGGWAVFYQVVPGTWTGTYQVCVTDVFKADWIYDPDQNAETCKNLIVP